MHWHNSLENCKTQKLQNGKIENMIKKKINSNNNNFKTASRMNSFFNNWPKTR